MIRTDNWLDKDFDDPIKICQHVKTSFSEDDSQKIYEYLMRYGMYKPNRRSYANFGNMKKQGIWEKTDELFNKYRRKWNGPNVPIYIFPIAIMNQLFSARQDVKSGIAFNDKLFLFLSPLEDEKEIEALLVHEYHHTCRINKQNKSMEEFTLLDSLIMEGLAENAVEECCGPSYRAKWCTYYTRKEILNYWERYIQEKLQIKKTDKEHDEILYGGRNIPKMLGYAAGYEIVTIYTEDNNLSMKQSLLLPAEGFVLI